MEEGPLTDARTGRRFPLTLPVKIKAGPSRRAQAATTDNLSAASVFITTDLPFQIGSTLNFEITLPAPIIGSKSDVEVKCAGRVVRVDTPTRGKRRGVACVIDRYRFVPQRKPRKAK
jgi:PilZ domain-containing protein